MNEQEFVTRISPIKLTVEKDGIEYEFESIGDVTDLEQLKLDIVGIMKRFKITVKSRDTVVIPKLISRSRRTLEEHYLKAKDVIREWYKENPEKEWSSGQLMQTVKFEKAERGSIMIKLTKEKFIRCVNPSDSRNKRRYVKTEAMVAPEAIEQRDMKKLEEERKLVRDVIG